MGAGRPAVELPPGLTVFVLGPATPVVVDALWRAGLRPVRGGRHATMWARPGDWGQR